MKKDTTSLLRFEFVDRYKERKIFNNYATLGAYEKILWITGKRGFGKTRFIKEMIKDISECKVIWIDNSIQDATSNVLTCFLETLQTECNVSLFDFIKNNYELFRDSAKEIFQILVSSRSELMSHITNIILGIASNKFENNISKDLYNTIIYYINEIIKKEKIFIVFDNFSRYDKMSVNFLLDIIRNYVSSKQIMICIITTDEDLERNSELERQIYMSIPYKNIVIKEFPSFIFFAEILHKIFGNILFNHNDVMYIYDKCQGNPENLIKLIQKGLKRDAIHIVDENISINKEAFYYILRNETSQFSLSDFKFKEQLLLLVIICVGKTINAKFLKYIIDYLTQKIFMYNQFTDDVFFETVGQLINDKIIEYNIDEKLEFTHDSIYIDICDILKELKLKPQICKCLFEMLLDSESNVNSYLNDINYYKSYYAAEAYLPGWEDINLEYAFSLSDAKKFHEACQIIDKIPHIYFEKTINTYTRIALIYYEDGQYQVCLNWLSELLPLNSNKNGLLFDYYFLLGKVQNILMKKEKAVEHFVMALKYIDTKSSQYVETLNLLHLTYMEILDGKKQAKEIFDYVKDAYENEHPLEWAKTMRGVANFYDGDEALNILGRASKIIENAHNDIEYAYISNSVGFIYLRNGMIDKAEKQFNIAYKILYENKIHETSYVLNNRSICKMLKGNYDEALPDLLEALLWNASPYAFYTINCHLCLCYYFLGQTDETNNIIDILEIYLFNNNIFDPVVERKICMNLGIVHHMLSNDILSKSYFERMDIEDVIDTSSEFRYLFYTKKKPVHNCCNNQYYKNINFEPWILIFGHD